MNVTINKNVLEHILINTQSFLDKKDSSHITSHILINVYDNIFNVKATDHEIGLSVDSTNVVIQENGLATANGRKLLDIVKILKDDDINIKVEDDNLFVTQKKSKYKLPMFNPNEFPEFPTIENKSQFKIDSFNFLKSIKKISPAIDTNNPKYELNGALIDIQDDHISFVATDTKRLAISLQQLNNQLEIQDLNIIIPKKAISEIQKLFFDEIEIFYDENLLIIKTDSFHFFTKLINGKFPDYKRIIPQDTKYELTLNREKIIEAIKQIAIVSPEIKITFQNDLIVFESLNENEAKTQLDFLSNIEEELFLDINSKHILDFLSNIEKNEFKLRYNDSSLPFMVESENFKTVIMPIIT